MRPCEFKSLGRFICRFNGLVAGLYTVYKMRSYGKEEDSD